MVLITIKPTVAFQQGDTFVFGSWVYIADTAGSFQRHLTPTPEKKPAFTMLLASPVEDLAENFGKILVSDPLMGHKVESEYYSGSTSSWVKPRELAPEPSCGSASTPQRLLFELRNTGAAYQAVLPKFRNPGKLPALEYYSDLDDVYSLTGGSASYFWVQGALPHQVHQVRGR
jgi:hypothetical protein